MKPAYLWVGIVIQYTGLTPFLAEMLLLEEQFTDIYQEFKNGNFVAQLSEANSFGRVEPDKCIEMTVNWV